MKETIFMKIINGEIPSFKVYEDDVVLAFLDAKPINSGHTLVIPKEQYENIFEIPDETLEHLIRVVKKVAIAVKKATGADGINIGMNNGSAAGQVVFHAHIHVMPRFEGDGYEAWHGRKEQSHEEQQKIAEKITKTMSKDVTS